MRLAAAPPLLRSKRKGCLSISSSERGGGVSLRERIIIVIISGNITIPTIVMFSKIKSTKVETRGAAMEKRGICE